MRSLSGTEALPGYYQIELAQAAYKLVTEMRPIQPGQQVLLSADTLSDPRVIHATAGAVQALGGVPTILTYVALPEPMMAPPAPGVQAAAAANVWFDFAGSYQLYSPAYHAALENGCIYVCLTGMDVDMMVRTIGKTRYQPMQRMATCLYELSQAAEIVRVTTQAGTDLTMKIDKAGDRFWEEPPAEGGFPQMLGGQSGFMAYRESYEGELVFDGALWPPTELGLLSQPVHLTLKGGYIQNIEGGVEAAVFSRWLEGHNNSFAYLMDHACYGFNPGVSAPTGRILEDERVFACMQFGVGATEYGSNAHTDGVVLSPSVWLDDDQIEDNGRYVHPQLIEYCREMGAAGY